MVCQLLLRKEGYYYVKGRYWSGFVIEIDFVKAKMSCCAGSWNLSDNRLELSS